MLSRVITCSVKKIPIFTIICAGKQVALWKLARPDEGDLFKWNKERPRVGLDVSMD